MYTCVLSLILVRVTYHPVPPFLYPPPLPQYACETPQDKAAAERAQIFVMGWFADPVFLGDYPEEMRETVRREAGREGGREALKNSDWLYERRQPRFLLIHLIIPLPPSLPSAATASLPLRLKRRLT